MNSDPLSESIPMIGNAKHVGGGWTVNHSVQNKAAKWCSRASKTQVSLSIGQVGPRGVPGLITLNLSASGNAVRA